MTDYPSVIALSALDGSNGFRMDGAQLFDRSGYAAASAGDVNGDGFDDVIVGALYTSPGGRYHAGVSYVVFGKASGFSATLDLSALDGTNGFRLDGAAASDFSGVSVASAGDVNGDGIDDVIIAADAADAGGKSNAGASYVVFGKTSGFAATLELSALDGTDGFRLDGAAKNDFSGRSVGAAGDVNGDGVGDLLVAADAANDYRGATYVVFGKTTGFDATLALSALDGTDGFRLDGVRVDDRSGFSASPAGDVNGDGYDDLIIGAFRAAAGGKVDAGSSYVVFGKASGFDPAMSLSALNGTNGFRLDGASAVESAGWSVSSAGDVNGDGFADLIIGATDASPGGVQTAGSSYVVFGKASGFDAKINLSTLDGTNGFRLDGSTNYGESGHWVASAGDFNGDGFDDVIVGAPGENGNAGATYVVFGKASGFDAAIVLSTLDGNDGFRLDGVDAYDESGSPAASAGDVNHDGFDDLIIGASWGDTSGRAGSSWVVFGSEPGQAVTRTGTDIANTIHGGEQDDLLRGLGGDDQLLGHGGSDHLLGGAGRDDLNGGNGDDTLEGGVGADHLAGGLGNDILIGGAGADRLAGGGGNDTFVFQSLTDLSLVGERRDVIQDFSAGDKIDLSAIDADASTGADDAFHVGRTHSHVGDIGIRYDAAHDRTTVKLFVDGDRAPDAVFAMVGDHTDLAAGDFVL